MIYMFRLIALVVASLLLPLASQAESVHLGADVVTSEEIVRLLGSGGHKERGIRLRNEHRENPAVDSAASLVPAAVSLEIYFGFDSAALTDQALKQLAPVGEALRSDELSRLAFIMEGHTDASGDENYNLSLSQMRAEAVKLHFVHAYEVDPERLSSVGKGESSLLKPNNPLDRSNRRVKIIAQ